MKVLHFYKTFYPETYGGVEQVIDQLAQGMNKYGIESKVLALTKSKSLKSGLFNGYKVHRSQSSLSLASTEFSFSAFKDFKKLAQDSDIIHYHFPNPFADILHFASKINKPSLITYHSDIVKQKNLLKIYQPLMHKFLKNVDTIVATSDNYINSSETLTKFKSKTKVIPIGINKNSYPNIDAEKLEYWKNKIGEKFFLFVGVPRYYKGLYNFLNAAKGAEYKIVIAGSGGIQNELESHAKTNNISNAVFLGAISDQDKVALINLSLGAILPSHLRSEAFGIFLLEGAMYGKPLISCEMGTGTTYINKHDTTGIVAKPNDILSLKKAMDFLFYNPDKAIMLGKNSKNRYNRLFTSDKMCADYYASYQELLK